MIAIKVSVVLLGVQMMSAEVHKHDPYNSLPYNTNLHKMSIALFKQNLICSLPEMKITNTCQAAENKAINLRYKLITESYNSLNGQPYLTLEVPKKVAKLLLSLNTINLENDLMLTVDERGRVVDYSLVAL